MESFVRYIMWKYFDKTVYNELTNNLAACFSCHRLSLMLSKHGSDKPAKEDPMSKEHWVSWEKKGCDYGFATSCYNYGVYLTKQNGKVFFDSLL